MLPRKTIYIIGVTAVCIGVVAAIVVYLILRTLTNNGCEIHPFEANLAPLIVLIGSNQFMYPNIGEKVLKFPSNQSVDFICSGQKIIVGAKTYNNSILTGKCVSRDVFEIDNVKVKWSQLQCDKPPWRTAKYTGNSCENAGSEIEVGFDAGDNRFLRSLLICFDQKLQIAHYTYINQIPSINQRALNTPRPSWLQGTGFYNIGLITNLYYRTNQRHTINSLIGIPANSTKYIEDGANLFLARGHLTARSDMFYPAQQNATFFMMNIAPQWQTFNGRNWKQIEIDVRDYAENNFVNLQVWTGVYGVTTLPHEQTGKPVELYLYVNAVSGRRALPVPELFWQVAYNPITQRGVVLIGVNNPYKTKFETICNDVSRQLTWLHIKNNDQDRGYCYACSIGTFRQVVKIMPNISDKGLLL